MEVCSCLPVEPGHVCSLRLLFGSPKYLATAHAWRRRLYISGWYDDVGDMTTMQR
jgi:hypothetical protein